MSLDRNRLPDPETYYEGEGLRLTGRGKWRTAPCPFHGGSDSMRVHVDSGAWVCMNCGVKGGDVLAFERERTGSSFETAARNLGAWIEDGREHSRPAKSRDFSAREALGVIARELLLIVVVISDARRGLTPSDADWHAFIEAAGNIEWLAREYAA